MAVFQNKYLCIKLAHRSTMSCVEVGCLGGGWLSSRFVVVSFALTS